MKILPVALLWFLSVVVASGAEPGATTPLLLDGASAKDVRYTSPAAGLVELETTGKGPLLHTQPLGAALPQGHHVLSFEYFCPQGLAPFQVWFGPKLARDQLVAARRLGSTEGWVTYALDLGEKIKDWGRPGDFLRLVLGDQPGVTLQVRNLVLRAPTARERELEQRREKQTALDAQLHRQLRAYLDATWPATIEHVAVSADQVTVRGVAPDGAGLFLAEVTPAMDVTAATGFPTLLPLPSARFELTMDRFQARGAVARYDRLLSKWVVVKRTGEQYELVSHARYADAIAARQDLPEEKPAGRKGLGGFSTRRGHIEDLTDLGITSATVNIWFTRFMYTQPAADRIEHRYNGKAYYFGRKDVEQFDATFRTSAEKNIVTAAILLVDPMENCPDPEIGRLLQHPDMAPEGIYSMPNMTTPESVDCYAAALDFLASRYSRPDKRYGRIHHWIMHNEVDAGWTWTNMGRKTDLVFMDAYVKSMRLCYHIARTYDAHSQVFISLTHYWAWTSRPEFYPSKDLMEILLAYTKVEGDFQWALAHHPYPESLREPKTWLDLKVTFDFSTPLITFKNLEVLDAWIKQPAVLYHGKHKRLLWLSENGTNSRTYSEQDLAEQAAGFAYAWKKMARLDGIDGFQWHNWFDSRREGGLRIGLRRFPDDETDPGGRKPVWFVYQAADTAQESAVFDPYKKLIGIDDWSQVLHVGEIDPAKKSAAFRDVRADTWVATDALGRSLPGRAEAGAPKSGRFVGMFYFVTHTRTGGAGPFDVTKIKAANPENPAWGNGAHFWGEPEIGYYLNQDEWAIRRHASQLVDAGVDVIIFDVTNDRTYPDVYLPVCKIWREMRAAGERTPDIAFLGSEKSVNTLWQEFYVKALYPELWFYWKGKPLLLYGQHEIPGRRLTNDIVFPEPIRNFFSLRQSWAWTSLPWYNDGRDEWPWVDHFPQAVGWHENRQRAEQVPVAVAQHPLSNIGRSFHQFHQPATDARDLTPVTGEGLFFQEQWSRALEVDPEFVFVTGWNEWSAGRQVMGPDITKDLLKWKFYPGAHLGRVGHELKTGDTYFIDQYNQEYSRDIEPMKGGHTDNYYYQLAANVRRYKGVSEPVRAGAPTSIDITGDFGQWRAVEAVYYDHVGDTAPRNSPGYASAGPYVDASGRNDLVESRVAYDEQNICFYARTQQKLSPHTDPRWMLLLIDADQNPRTGWQGYDLLVNQDVRSATQTTLQAWRAGRWENVAELPLHYRDHELMLAVPAKLLPGGPAGFDFHWVDHPPSLHDIADLFIGGDNAPERRFNYRFPRTRP